MNQKAKKQQINFPPVLNLSKSDFNVDTSFNRAERLNAPFINDKLSPLYKKETDGKTVTFDKDGNRFEIADGVLYKNDTALFDVASKMFIKKDVSEEMMDLIAWDNGSKATFNEGSNTITFDGLSTDRLYDEGSIVASRIKKFKTKSVLVVYFKGNNDTRKVLIAVNDGDTLSQSVFDGKWIIQKIRTKTTGQYQYPEVEVQSAYPLIQIAEVMNNTIGVSLVSNYGGIEASDSTGFMTFFINGETIYRIGESILPSTESVTREVETKTQAYFLTQQSKNASSFNGIAVIDNGKYYQFLGNEGLGPELNFGSYVPSKTGNEVEINGVTYAAYSYVELTLSVNVSVTSNQPIEYTVWTNGRNETTLSKIVYGSYNNNIPYPVVEKIEIEWNSIKTEIPKSFWNQSYLVERTSVTPTSVSHLAYPSIVCDNGKLYTMFSFDLPTGTSWDKSLAVGSYIVESGTLSSISGSTYSVSTNESVAITSDYNNVRSNGYCLGQNFYQSNVKLNNSSATVPSETGSKEDPDAARYLEYTNSNTYPLLYFAGTNSDSTKKYYKSETVNDVESYPIYTPIGTRSEIGKFNLLFNVWNVASVSSSAVLQGISYSEDINEMGTLLTEWQSVNGEWYVSGNDTKIRYKGIDSKFWEIEIVDGNDIFSILDGKMIVVNTTSYWNAWDCEKNIKVHYATDYNGRTTFGYTEPENLNGMSKRKRSIRLISTAINASYRIDPHYKTMSMLIPEYTVARVNVNYIDTIKTASPEDRDVQPIDIYFSDAGKTTSLPYRLSIKPYFIESSYRDFNLNGTTWVTLSDMIISPSLFAKYLDGMGLNDFIIEDNRAYSMVYYNNMPYLSYIANTEVDNITKVFVLQGQSYAIIDDKIFSIIYSNGLIQSMDAVIDLGDLVFIGNTPSVALFWSKSLRAIYSFTGDANLQILQDANKISDCYGYYYDYSTQSIWICTDIGVLVVSSRNTFLLENIINVKSIQFTKDGLTHIIGDNVIDFSYYPIDGFVCNGVIFETSLYGFGDTESTSIDRWNIVIEGSGEYKVGVRTLTDVTTKTEMKEGKIASSEVDAISGTSMISFNPKLIKGQGISLKVETEGALCRIVPHISDNGNGTVVRPTHSV